jgi:hypothetical protein
MFSRAGADVKTRPADSGQPSMVSGKGHAATVSVVSTHWAWAIVTAGAGRQQTGRVFIVPPKCLQAHSHCLPAGPPCQSLDALRLVSTASGSGLRQQSCPFDLFGLRQRSWALALLDCGSTTAALTSAQPGRGSSTAALTGQPCAVGTSPRCLLHSTARTPGRLRVS